MHSSVNQFASHGVAAVSVCVEERVPSSRESWTSAEDVPVQGQSQAHEGLHSRWSSPVQECLVASAVCSGKIVSRVSQPPTLLGWVRWASRMPPLLDSQSFFLASPSDNFLTSESVDTFREVCREYAVFCSVSGLDAGTVTCSLGPGHVHSLHILQRLLQLLDFGWSLYNVGVRWCT